MSLKRLTKECLAWHLALDVQENQNPLDMDIFYGDIQTPEEEICQTFIIMHSKGYYFHIGRVFICKPEESYQYIDEGVDEDGFMYSITQPFEGFNTASDEEVVEMLKAISKNEELKALTPNA